MTPTPCLKGLGAVLLTGALDAQQKKASLRVPVPRSLPTRVFFHLASSILYLSVCRFDAQQIASWMGGWRRYLVCQIVRNEDIEYQNCKGITTFFRPKAASMAGHLYSPLRSADAREQQQSARTFSSLPQTASR